MAPRNSKARKIAKGKTTTKKSATKSSKGGTSVAAMTRGGRGRAGSLQQLPNMPWDVLFDVSFVGSVPCCSERPSLADVNDVMQILSRVSLPDILHLSRLCKDFRSFFMSKHSAPFWKAARANVEGLPECPDDMSEPAYASLVFSDHCDVSHLSAESPRRRI